MINIISLWHLQVFAYSITNILLDFILKKGGLIIILGRPYDGIIGGLILFTILYPFRFKKQPLLRNLFMMALYSYVGALISLTMIYAPPWNWNISKESTQFALSCIITTPFEESLQIYQNCLKSGNFHAFIRLVGGNLVMLIPLGIIVPILYPKYNFIKMLLLAMLTSFLIEFFQLTTNILLGQVLRTVEIDDFIQNVFGCIIAYSIFVLFRKIYKYLVPIKSIT